MSSPVERLQAAVADRYRVERELGHGGMATVHLATDLKHDRLVAIKLLRPELSAIIGAERFLGEIKVTAHLQHPHILPLYDSGSADGLLYYVMPYVQGESLRDRMVREKQLPVDDAVEITRAVAGALDYAHRHRVVHRDIKPENILLHDGQPMVADFGIALAVSAAGGHRLTETGLSLGTPHYMSPEQATGDRDLDGRSDIYSLGCVAYEMLAGHPPHTGATAQAIITKIVTEAPPALVAARASVPPHVQAAIHRAVEKVPADRFGTAGQFAEALAHPASGATTRVMPARGRALRRAGWWPWALAAGLALIVGVAAGRLTGRDGAPTPRVMRFVVPFGPDHTLVTGPSPMLAVSPDGRELAYVAIARQGGATFGLYRRRFEALEATAIPGTLGGVGPAYSPDGKALAFVDYFAKQLRRVPVEGGAAVPLPTPPTTLYAPVWDGTGGLAFVDNRSDRLFAFRDNAADSVPVIPLDSASGESGHRFPDFLPGGGVLVTFSAARLAGARLGGTGVAVVWPGTGKRKVVVPNAAGGARYSPTGHIIWASEDGSLLGARFDPREGEMTGPPVLLAKSVAISTGSGAGGIPQFGISREGTLVYLPAVQTEVVLVDRHGAATPITKPDQLYHAPRFSPDGRSISVDINQPTGRDVWVHDLDQGTMTRVSFEGDVNDPVWSADGRRVCFGSAKQLRLRGVYCRNVDGTGGADSLYAGSTEFTPGAFLPDGRGVVLIAEPGGSATDLWYMPLGSGAAAEPLLAQPHREGFPSVSFDGAWLAYVSDESGAPEVYVRPLGNAGGRVQVSQNGGTEPVWSRKGRELFYIDPSRPTEPALTVAVVEKSPALRVRSRTRLFDYARYEIATPHANYDVHPDGQRFVMIRRGAASEMVVVQNWHLIVDAGSAGKGPR